MSNHTSAEALARVLDPDAFADHPAEHRSNAAAVQWSARRKMVTEYAERAVAWHAEQVAQALDDVEKRIASITILGSSALAQGGKIALGECIETLAAFRAAEGIRPVSQEDQ